MGKITNLVLNSNTKIMGTDTTNLSYYVDWSALLKNNQQYKMTFSYIYITFNL